MKKRRTSFESIFRKFTAVIAGIGLAAAIASQITSIYESKQEELLLQERAFQMRKFSDSMIQKINKQNELIRAKIAELTKENLPKDVYLNQKLEEIDSRLSTVEEQTKGLRQAINPLNPEEILTIARLNDALNAVHEKQLNLTETTEDKFDNFKASVIRELDASSKSINWLFLVLIPVVMNLLYSIWKDNKEKRLKTDKDAHSPTQQA